MDYYRFLINVDNCINMQDYEMFLYERINFGRLSLYDVGTNGGEDYNFKAPFAEVSSKINTGLTQCKNHLLAIVLRVSYKEDEHEYRNTILYRLQAIEEAYNECKLDSCGIGLSVNVFLWYDVKSIDVNSANFGSYFDKRYMKDFALSNKNCNERDSYSDTIQSIMKIREIRIDFSDSQMKAINSLVLMEALNSNNEDKEYETISDYFDRIFARIDNSDKKPDRYGRILSKYKNTLARNKKILNNEKKEGSKEFQNYSSPEDLKAEYASAGEDSEEDPYGLNEFKKKSVESFENVWSEKYQELLNSIDSNIGLKKFSNSIIGKFNEAKTKRIEELRNFNASEYKIPNDIDSVISEKANNISDLENKLQNPGLTEKLLLEDKINAENSLKAINENIKRYLMINGIANNNFFGKTAMWVCILTFGLYLVINWGYFQEISSIIYALGYCVLTILIILTSRKVVELYCTSKIHEQVKLLDDALEKYNSRLIAKKECFTKYYNSLNKIESISSYIEKLNRIKKIYTDFEDRKKRHINWLDSHIEKVEILNGFLGKVSTAEYDKSHDTVEDNNMVNIYRSVIENSVYYPPIGG